MVQRMTDPVTNVEIEDVLSSIRRLVSDDERVVKPAPKVVKQPDRLVLTPALRVSGDDHEDEADEPTKRAAELEKAPESQNDSDTPVLLTDLAPLVEEATPAEQTPENTEKLSENDIENVSFEHGSEVVDPVESDGPDDLERDTTTEAADSADEAEGLTFQDGQADVPSELPAGDENSHDSEVADAENDGVDVLTSHLLSQLVEEEVEQVLGGVEPAEAEVGPDVGRGDAEDSAAQVANEEAALLHALTEEDEAVADMVEAETDGEPEVEESLESKIAALEELVGRSHEEEWEPEQSEPDAPVFHRSSDVLEWQDHLPNTSVTPDETVVDPAAGDQPVRETAAPVERDASAASSDAVTIDEDTLRGLVSEIVRQELQGALGERITRNVRKLVRREIHRVLMSQDFD